MLQGIRTACSAASAPQRSAFGGGVTDAQHVRLRPQGTPAARWHPVSLFHASFVVVRRIPPEAPSQTPCELDSVLARLARRSRSAKRTSSKLPLPLPVPSSQTQPNHALLHPWTLLPRPAPGLKAAHDRRNLAAAQGRENFSARGKLKALRVSLASLARRREPGDRRGNEPQRAVSSGRSMKWRKRCRKGRSKPP